MTLKIQHLSHFFVAAALGLTACGEQPPACIPYDETAFEEAGIRVNDALPFRDNDTSSVSAGGVSATITECGFIRKQDPSSFSSPAGEGEDGTDPTIPPDNQIFR